MFPPQVSNLDSGQDRIFVVITYWEIALLYPTSNCQHIVSFRVVTAIWDIFQESKGTGAGWKSHVTHRESTSKHTGNCIDITPENDTSQITNLTEHKEISVLLTAIQVIQIFLHIRVTIMIWGNFCMVSMHPQYHNGAEISSQQPTHLLCRNFFTTNQTFVMKKFPQNNLYLYYTEISS